MNNQIELSCGFGELSLNDFAEAKKSKAIGETERKEEVEEQLPEIQEEAGNDLGAAILGEAENGGGQIPNPTQQETDEVNS